jgi:glutathione synthase
MALKVALQMDPIGSVNINADSTFRIALEAQARGHSLFFYTPDRLAFVEGRVMARGWPIEVRRELGNHVTYGAETEVDLGDLRCRLAAAGPALRHGLYHHDASAGDDPSEDAGGERSVLGAQLPGKAAGPALPDLTPPTAIARDLATIRAFKARHGDIILKPLVWQRRRGCVPAGPERPQPLVAARAVHGHQPRALIVQKFLPAVAKGDKRVILVDGEPVGAINRVPQAGETRSNMHAGGRPKRWA